MRSYSSRPLFTVILNCRLVVRAVVQNDPNFYDRLVLFIDDVLLVCDITKTVWLHESKEGKKVSCPQDLFLKGLFRFFFLLKF